MDAEPILEYFISLLGDVVASLSAMMIPGLGISVFALIVANFIVLTLIFGIFLVKGRKDG